MKKPNRKHMCMMFCIMLSLTIFCGCAASSRPLSQLDYVKSLEVGVTNRSEVLEALGDPIKDIGSGVYIDLYEIEGHTIKIGYTYTPDGNGLEKWVVNFVTIDGETYMT